MYDNGFETKEKNLTDDQITPQHILVTKQQFCIYLSNLATGLVASTSLMIHIPTNIQAIL